MANISITKKALKETVYEQIFTGNRVKITVLWFDRQQGEYTENGTTKRFAGAKYMIASMLTKAETYALLHDWLTTGNQSYNQNVKYWMAEHDKDRRKAPLSFNWNSY